MTSQKRLSIPTHLVVLLTLLSMVAASGCSSSDADTMAEINSISGQLEADGKPMPALVVPDGPDKVGTIYVQSHLDELMPAVAKLQNVKEVSAKGLGDEHVQHIPATSSLNSVVLGDAKLTDAGLEQLVEKLESTKIDGLIITNAPLTSASLKPLSRLTMLNSLDLTGTQVAADLTPLSKLVNLEWLLLRDMDLSQLDQNSIQTLAELPKLGRLTVTGTGITAEAMGIIKKANPALNLETGPTGASADPAGETLPPEDADSQ